MIKNIVFDIGDVLVGYDPKDYATQSNLDIHQVNIANDLLIKSFEWRHYLNGNITLDSILTTFCTNYPDLKKEFSLLLCKENIAHIIYEIKENTNLLKELSNNYKIYLLSNITKETLESIYDKFDFVKYISGAIYSFEEHISKPEKDIFYKLLNKYSINVEETLYIDDRRKNVQVAQDIGMHGIVYYNDSSLNKLIGGFLN